MENRGLQFVIKRNKGLNTGDIEQFHNSALSTRNTVFSFTLCMASRYEGHSLSARTMNFIFTHKYFYSSFRQGILITYMFLNE